MDLVAAPANKQDLFDDDDLDVGSATAVQGWAPIPGV